MVEPAWYSEATKPSTVAPTATTPDLNSWIMGMGIAGLGLQAYGAYSEGEARAEALEYNAFVAEQDAKEVEKAKKHELHKSVTAQRKLLARQWAVAAASGRSMSGSPLDVMNRTESEALLDQSIIRSNAATAKGRLHGQAIMDRGQAESARKMGRAKSITGLFISGADYYSKTNYFKSKSKGST